MIMLGEILKSFKRALAGLGRLFQEERSFRIQVIFGLVVWVFMWLLPIATSDRIIVILLSVGVWILEIFNSVLERLADALAPRLSYLVKDIKDMMAGAVLLMSFVAVIIGLMIFGSPVLNTICGTLSICIAQTL